MVHIETMKGLAPVFETTLTSGLKLYMFDVPGSGRIFADLWFGVGAKNEKTTEFGISHFLEHMIFKGNERFGPGEIDSLTESSGGYNNAATHSEYTHYYFVMPKTKLGLALTLLSEMCTRPAIDDGEFGREREVVLEEIKQYRDHPVYGAYSEHQKHFYKGTAWGHSTLGTEETLVAMTPEVMRKHHRTFYRPGNASLIIAGSISDPAKTAKLVEKTFENWKDTNVSIPEPDFGELKSGEFKHFLKSQNESIYGFLSFSAFGGDLSKDSALLSVLLYVLGGTFTSKLHQALLEEDQLCQEFDLMSENTHPINAVVFSFTTDDSTKVKPIFDALKKHLQNAAYGTLSQQEISGAKAALMAHRAVDAESTPGAGGWLGELAYPRRRICEIEQYEEYMEKATPSELKETAQKLLSNIRRIGLTVTYPEDMPRPQAPNSLRSFFSISKLKTGIRANKSEEPRFVAHLDCGAKLFAWPAQDSKMFTAKFYLPYNILEEPLAGISRIANRVLLKGTKGKTAIEISRAFEAVGGSIGAAFSQMHIGLEAGVLAPDWKLPIEMIPEIFSAAAFNGEETRKAVWEAKAALQSQKDQNRSVAWAKFSSEFFPNSPFGVQALGDEKGLSRISGSSLRKYFSRITGLKNMRIVASGKYDESELIDKLNLELGRHVFADKGSSCPPEGKFAGRKRRIEIAMDKEQTALIVGIPAPGIYSNEHEYWELINCILGVGATSRLFVNLRDRDSLAYAVYSMYVAGRRLGCLAIAILTSREKLEEAWSGIFREIDFLFHGAITKAEFVAAKTFVTQQSLNAIETTTGKARELAKAVLLDLSPSHALERIRHLNEIQYGDFRDYLSTLKLKDWGAVQVGRK